MISASQFPEELATDSRPLVSAVRAKFLTQCSLQDKGQSFKGQLAAISRTSSTHIEESPADVFKV